MALSEGILGLEIRRLREHRQILLRELAAKLQIDTAQLSKMENGKRHFKKDQIQPLAELLGTSKTKLLTLWYTDEITAVIGIEPEAQKALELVLNKIQNSTNS